MTFLRKGEIQANCSRSRSQQQVSFHRVDGRYFARLADVRLQASRSNKVTYEWKVPFSHWGSDIYSKTEKVLYIRSYITINKSKIIFWGNYLLKDAVKKRKMTDLELCVRYQRKDEKTGACSRSLFIELTGNILQGSADVYFKCICKPASVTK